MLTIYSIVKPFAGEFDVIQRNAIGSWLRLVPTPEVLLFGSDEPGAQEYAAEMGLPIYPIEYTAYHAPILRSCVEPAEQMARNPIRCLVNADIIITGGLITALRMTAERFPKFFLSARRWDLDYQIPIAFDDAQWETRLQARCRQRGALHHKSAIDLFCQRGISWLPMPEFAIRFAWDNWMVWKALDNGPNVAFVDATDSVYLIHPQHAYHHADQNTERRINKQIYGTSEAAAGRMCGFQNATHMITVQGQWMRYVRKIHKWEAEKV